MKTMTYKRITETELSRKLEEPAIDSLFDLYSQNFIGKHSLPKDNTDIISAEYFARAGINRGRC
jgi:hypothetical protein